MKKILLAITLFISSCNTSNNTNIISKNTPMPSTNLTSTTIGNADSTSKDEDIYNQDGEIINCGILEENSKKLSMTCPTNIVTNKDFVYFTKRTFYTNLII